MTNIYCVFHNIRSSHNVGALFRTADGAGVAKIFLTGYTPTPNDRFGRPNASLIKTALGATDSVSYEYVADIQDLLNRLDREKCTPVVVEQTSHARSYRTFVPTGDTAFIFGNEITGVEPEVCERVPTHIMIPMFGKKESLNVTTSAGIILFHMRG